MNRTSIPASKEPRHDAGALFAALAIAIAIAAQIIGDRAAIAAGLTMFLMGIAHGAGEEADQGMAPLGWRQTGAYVVIGSAVAGLFVVMPLAGLVLFLGLSLWHFASSHTAIDSLNSWAIAALAIGGSALFRPHSTAIAFAHVLGQPMPQVAIYILALCGFLGSALALVGIWRRAKGYYHVFIALCAISLLHPVLGVGLIFLICHAFPIQQRQFRQFGTDAVIRAIVWPTAVAAIGAILLAAAVTQGWIGLPIAAAFAFGLATPHMLTDRIGC